MRTYLKDASWDTLKSEMRRLRDEGARNAKVWKLAELATLGQPDPISAIHRFVQQTFPYTPDPEESELFIHPRKIAEDYFSGHARSFDCDDFALLTSAMLSSIGYESRMILVERKGPGFDHALAQVNTQIGWLSVDTSSKNPVGWLENYKQIAVV